MSESKEVYVRRRPLVNTHHCLWPGCTRRCPVSMWGCLPHWQMLPAHARRRIWEAYRSGQKSPDRPSEEYLSVLMDVREWILWHHRPK